MTRNCGESEFGRCTHHDYRYRPLARDAARQSITLLANTNGTLPLKLASYKRVLVLGALAQDAESHVGAYTNDGARVVTLWDALNAAVFAATGTNATFLGGARASS